MFMFDEVPDPVWYTSIGNSASCAPLTTSSAEAAMASAIAWSSTPSCALARAADFLMRARATIWAGSRPDPEIGKFSTARCVCAPYSASMGTRTSPMVSCSIRYSGWVVKAFASLAQWRCEVWW